MSVHILNSITPFFRILKKNIRRWIISTLFFVFSFLLCSIVAAPKLLNWPGLGAIIFIIFVIIQLIIYFKNISKNTLLKSSIVDYGDIEKVDIFIKPYRRLYFFSRLIIIVDSLLFIFFPLTFPLKLAFWINYRRLKSRFKKMRKMILKGERALEDDSIEKDPFYDFLMREGLYETRRQTTEERREEEEQKQETLPKQPNSSENPNANEDIKDTKG